MSNSESREALRGEGERILDLLSEAFTSEQWAELLVTALAATKGLDRGLAQKLVEAGAPIGLALHAAVRGSHGYLVNHLLENECAPIDVYCRDINDNTPLHVAARMGEAEIVRSLLLKGASKDARNEQGYTPFYITAQHGHVAAAQALLAAGANVNVRIAGSSPVLEAVECEHVEFLRMLGENGADVHAVHGVNKSTALHVAAWNGQDSDQGAVDVLIEAGANIDAKDYNGRTPLHDAAETLCCHAARALLKHGANVNARCFSGRTPLLHAVRLTGALPRAAEMVDLLLRSGADETLVNNHGANAADVLGQGVDEPEESLAGDAERVRRLLENAPADRAWRRRGYLVLCRAHPDRVQLPRDNSQTHAGTAQGHRRHRSEPAKADKGNHLGRTGSDSADERAGREWTAVAARLLRVREEGLFRVIVGYL